jgi:hypothetical protein
VTKRASLSHNSGGSVCYELASQPVKDSAVHATKAEQKTAMSLVLLSVLS